MPTYANLNKRHISTPILCLLCHTDLESVDHLLRFCPVTSQFLTSLRFTVRFMSKHLDYKYWPVEVFQTTDDRNRKLVTLSVWSIWFARNKLIHEGTSQTLSDLVVFVLGYLAKIEALEIVGYPRCSSTQIHWRPLDLDFITVNFDSSFNLQEKTSISGIIARNERGLVMGACTYPHINIADAFVVEARTYEQAI
ncbi:hypothetical protein ERO13_A13G134766v2 [Gossypium hirsutum]|uniref:Reverse transcriptase zinc-binding domain-containing protein n=1 Tax=Gossypium mustelinum TaxID=34275 RepID=A0A5D2WI04_GOSMU|nr:hypothetical protein ERO13_A13G134766v2 [Gossypium hirsutum]TYJ01475.1 hypothetical protein E1A91_A13G156300v1 [Gossypium mustelinum]